MIDVLGPALILLIQSYMTWAPFTKVEESFNMQAGYDILNYGVFNISNYDHFKFPGVVPRTFVGATVLSFFNWIVSSYFVGSDEPTQISYQLNYRALLGVMNAVALVNLRNAIASCCCEKDEDGNVLRGKFMKFWYGFMQFSQFHIIYYASRTLPNFLALPLTNVALALILYDRLQAAFTLLFFVGIVFRAEVALFAGAIGFFFVMNRRLRILHMMFYAFTGICIGVSVCLLVDVHFWNRPLMVPEVYAYIYNVVDGNSSNWGQEPWPAYFVRYLPTLLVSPAMLPLAVVGYFKDYSKKNNARVLLLGSIMFIFIFSFLPHKEWRFIIYTVPVFTLMSAQGANFLTERAARSVVYRIGVAVVSLATLCAYGISFFMMYCSSWNYPGGNAEAAFNSMIQTTYGNTTKPVELTVHLDVPTCMTGATLFNQIVPGWHNVTVHYDRTENQSDLAALWDSFDYLITFADNGMPEKTLAASVDRETAERAKVLQNPRDGEWVKVQSIEGLAGVSTQPLVEAAMDTLESMRSLVSEGPIDQRVPAVINAVAEVLDPEFLRVWGTQLLRQTVATQNLTFIYKKVPHHPRDTDRAYAEQQAVLQGLL